MENPYFLEKYTQIRHKEMLEAARLERLIQEAKAQKPKPCQALTWRIGDWLMELGRRLKHQQNAYGESLIFNLKIEGSQDGPQHNDLCSE